MKSFYFFNKSNKGGGEINRVPSTRSTTRDLDFELDRKAQESMEPVESHVGYVSDVRWPPNLHMMNGGAPIIASLIDAARSHRFPQRRQQGCHQGQLVLLLLCRARPCLRLFGASAAALCHHDETRHLGVKPTSPKWMVWVESWGKEIERERWLHREQKKGFEVRV